MNLDSLTRVVTRSELVSAGYADNEIAAAVPRDVLRSLGRGVYAPPTIADLPREQRYPHIVRSAVSTMPAGRAVASVSAVALHGLPMWGLDLRRIHMVEVGDGSGTRETRSTVLHRDHRPMHWIEVDGVRVVGVARTVVDIARASGRDVAVVVGDAALKRGLCTPDDLRRELALIEATPGCVAARRAVRLMDGRSESVLESRSRLAMLDSGLPTPIPQYEIFDDDGQLLARVDFAWPELGVIAEADGEEKYIGDTRAILAREKYRIDRLIELGWRVVRWSWGDLERGEFIPRVLRILNGASVAHFSPPRP
ncbi:hypothetical protein [Williamsia phyllosphaerae]|uniref:DUF559 domain-containing protein n=1 Tax=Williamsia phyllosphaerae TaxID=885042 RepID=A0ABQ1U3J2_9NOCA|nr:hypothetical protein [Williamsia phyllosphaerae]GGF09781.1 hypothetical protein GCM10007298_02140 [Williamsia phyllosphaerae]